MGSMFELTDDDPLKNDLEKELLYRRYCLGISDIDDYGCEITEEERFAILGMKHRIIKKVVETLDEEIKNCIIEIRTPPNRNL